ncbi:MAG: tyrosinase family protein [Steroidobacteraceae bacterium]|nr:tyrosinase family protein [Steroidobacteraceae bacterium]
MNVRMNRRSVLKAGTAAVVGAVTQPFIGIPALAAYAAGPTVRRNAFTMATSDPILVGYRKAITAMKALPLEDPCSWGYQAAIHGTTVTPALTAWNSCHTNANYFWSWHRMYLYWFERIVRKHSGMYDWALPYWDWANPAQRQLPPAFRVVGSALYDASRIATMNDGTGMISTGLGTSVTMAYTHLNFFTAQSGINGPHGSVHGAISGNMCCFQSAAQDPIFWTHHSNVDRQWNLWLAQGGGRTNPLSDAAWKNTQFTFFDECCHQVTMTGCQVLRAAKQLSYIYEEEPAQVEQYCPRVWNPGIFEIAVIAQFRRPPFWLTKQSTIFPLYGDDVDGKTLGARLAELARTPGQTAVLQLKGVEAKMQPGASWEVYVGPVGLTPDPRGPHFVGVLGMFAGGLPKPDHYHTGEFVYPIDKAVSASGDPSKLQVLFVPTSGIEVRGRPLPAEVRADVSVAEVSIIVDVAMPQPPREEQEQLKREELQD